MGSRLPADCLGVQPDSADLRFRQSLQVAGNRMYGSISSFFVLPESNNPPARNDFDSDSASAVKLTQPAPGVAALPSPVPVIAR